MNVMDGHVGVHFCFGNPSVIGKCMLEFPFLPRGGLIYERGNIFGLFSVEPRGVPKRSNILITNGDSGGCIEEVHIHLTTWGTHAHPKLTRVTPFKPRPSQPKSPRKFLEM